MNAKVTEIAHPEDGDCCVQNVNRTRRRKVAGRQAQGCTIHIRVSGGFTRFHSTNTMWRENIKPRNISIYSGTSLTIHFKSAYGIFTPV
jgi:hypothetical protein